MNRNGSIVILSFILVVTLFSCSNKPRNLIEEDKMIALLTDMNVAKAVYNNNAFRTDSMRDALTQSVLDKHGVTQVDLDSSLVWYSDDMKTYMKISDSVSSILRRRYDILHNEWNRATALSLPSDMMLKSVIRLEDAEPNYSFNIDSAKFATLKKEYFAWSFSVNGVSPTEKVTVGIFFKYKDSLVKEIFDVKENKSFKLTKPNLPDSMLQSISGYIHRMTGDKTRYFPPVIISKISYSDSIKLRIDSLKHTSVRDSLNMNIDSLNVVLDKKKLLDSLSAK